MAPTSWLPPVVWMGVMFWLSSDTGSAEHTGGWLAPLLRTLLPSVTPEQFEAVHVLARKAAHVGEYAILAALWFRALTRSRWTPPAAAWTALAISAAWAGLDEAHQWLVPSRGARLADVALDSAGAAMATVAARLGRRRAAGLASGVLLWIAAVGGGLILVLDALAGTPRRAVWLTAPAAAAVLVIRRLRRAR